MKGSAMAKEIIFVTGYFGAPIRTTAEGLAKESGAAIVSLDEEIKRRDGRSVMRICMTMGEHEYRNREYEVLRELIKRVPDEGLVVCCGDGVLNDEMSREILTAHRLVFVGGDMSLQQLWENAAAVTDSPHAFMHFGDEASKKRSFAELHERQRRMLVTNGIVRD